MRISQGLQDARPDVFGGGGARVLLAALLRDFAAQLAHLAAALGFSIGEFATRSFSGRSLGDASPAFVYTVYDEVQVYLEPGPAAMFVALALTEDSPLSGLWAPAELYAAAGMPAPQARRDPDRSVYRHANSDLPTAEDDLGTTPLVEGLCGLLDDPRTDPSISIGVTAPWGGGKSSLMFRLREALGAPHLDRHRTWIPIRFDAWKYERSERIWAALARAIYEQGQAGMGLWERIVFRYGLERRRRGWLRTVGGPALVFLVLLAVLVLVLAHSTLLAGVVSGILFALGLGSVTGRMWGLFSDPFKRALDGYTANPHYEEQLGFTTEANADVEVLTGLLAGEPGRALVVFVDDLDRCSPRHVVETVEAINQIFNAAGDGDGSESRRANCAFKVVQLSVAVRPPGEEEAIDRLREAIGPLEPVGDGSPSGPVEIVRLQTQTFLRIS